MEAYSLNLEGEVSMNTKKPVYPTTATIIFHKSKDNAEESLKNQQSFLKRHKKLLASAKIIDYVNGQSEKLCEVNDAIHLAIQKQLSRLIIIVNSPISLKQWDRQYDMYGSLKLFGTMERAELYFMDSEGTIYKRVDDIDRKKSLLV